MHLELHTIQWLCEFCGATKIVKSTDKHERPPGWGTKTVGGFGLTGYSKDMDCCKACNQKTLKYGPNETFYLE